MATDINIQEVTLETDRLVLRGWRQEDLDDFYEYAKVEGVGEAAGWIHHASKEESQKILTMFIEEGNDFAIVNKENNKVIGSFGIMDYTSEDEVLMSQRGKEIGYVLSKDYWGMGLMSEAATVVKEYLFTSCSMDYLICGYFTGNDKSKRVAEKLGFRALNQKVVERPSGTFVLNQTILYK